MPQQAEKAFEVTVVLESDLIFQVEKCGWSARPLSSGWRLQHRQSQRVVLLHRSQHWLCLSAPLQEQSQAQTLEERVAFLQHLAQRNERMFLAKYGLDSEGVPLLLVELPVAALNSIQLKRALDACIHYADSCAVFAQAGSSAPHLSMLTRIHGPDVEAGISKDTFMRYMQGLDRWHIKDELLAFPWHMVYINSLRPFDVYCTISTHWVSLQVSLLVEQTNTVLRASLQEQALFLEYLLRLNQRWFLAKAGINDEKQILMLVEVPTETFDFALFRTITRTLAAYIDSYSQEIQLMASLQEDTRLVELLCSPAYAGQ